MWRLNPLSLQRIHKNLEQSDLLESQVKQHKERLEGSYAATDHWNVETAMWEISVSEWNPAE